MPSRQAFTGQKIKVLQFPIADSKGGITSYVLQNWKFIDHAKFQFDFATRSPSLSFSDELLAEGCKIHFLSCSSEEDEARFIKEIHGILDEGYHVIHLHTSYWKGLLVEQIAMERKVPMVIIHAHSTMVDLSDNVKRNLAVQKHMALREEISLKDATHFWACSDEAAEWLFGSQIPRNQIEIMPNAIDLEKFAFSSRSRERLRSDLGLSGKMVLGHIGRFCYQKNHSFLLDVFSKVYSGNPESRLLLVGDGPLESDIRSQIGQYGLEKAVVMLGYRSDIAELLSCMDLFLFPSHFEGLGIVLVEAQANGLPCLVSSTVPREARLSDGIRFCSLDSNEWVEAIRGYGKDYQRTGAESVVDLAGYSLKTQIERLENNYSLGFQEA